MTESSTNKLPETWELTDIGTVYEVVGGGTPATRKEEFWNGDVPWITSADIRGVRRVDVTRFVTDRGVEGSATNKVPVRTLLVVTRVGLGKIAIADREICFSQDIQGLLQDPDVVLPEYALYYLSYQLQRLKYEGRGTTIAGLTKKQLKDTVFPLAPRSEQLRIVAKIEELLSELDKGLESLKTAKEQLTVYRQTILKHAFEGKLTEKWRKENKRELPTTKQLSALVQHERDAVHQRQLAAWTESVKAWELDGITANKPIKPKQPRPVAILPAAELGKLPPLPDTYLYTYLANLGNLGRGKSKHRPRNDARLFGGQYPFIQTGEVKAANRVIQEYSQTYSDFGLAQSKLWPKGTLCITIAANIAETAFLGFDGCFPDSVVGFMPIRSLVLPEYVELFIKAVRIQIEAYAPATAQKNINLTTLENLVVPLCSIEEQKRLVNELEAILSAIDANAAEIESTVARVAALRQSILKRAFSGLLVEQDPSDEPASILLERIRVGKKKESKGKRQSRKRKGRKEAV